MSFSFCRVIILNDEIGESEKGGDDRIDEKGVGFKRLCDFGVIFIEVCSSFSLLNGSLRSSKSSRRVNGFDF